MEQAQRYPHLSMVGPTRGEWDLNDWKWDGDLFLATPSSAATPAAVLPNFTGHQQLIPLSGNSSNSSSSCSDDLHNGRKRRVLVGNHDEDEAPAAAAAASLALKLGGSSSWEGANIHDKKAKVGGVNPTSRAVCQVEDCGADLAKAKDYHRRHKVCEVHSKATKALVNSVLQRFCQQCSRFHVLEEFDEGKRSCRRRLAGHNKRRRKTQPEPPANANPIPDDHTSSVLLISLLKILSNMHSNNRSDQTTDQHLVAQLLSSLANPSGLQAGSGISGLLHDSQKLLTGEIPSKGTTSADTRSLETQGGSPQNAASLFPVKESPPTYSESTDGRAKMNNFDLNDIYIDSDDGTEELERSPVNGTYATGSVDFPPWARHDSHQSSPPQTSGNSDSASAQSPLSSSGEAQSRTDRIVFKLFGKEPGDFPLVLRGQILDWLAHSPTEIESYIKPGCIILTVYLRLAESSWEEICSDLSSCLTRLFDISDDPFWSTGWVYVRVRNQIAFVHDGQIVLETFLPVEVNDCSTILSVTPIAASLHEQVQFQVRGFNLSQSGTRLLCALEGKYIDLETSLESRPDDDVEEEDEIEHASLSCSIPNTVGRGFIEVEDYGLSSSFFPFIVAEKDVCSEIRMLESALELNKTTEDTYEVNGSSEARRRAMDFLNEMGWLLHRIQLKSRLAHLDPSTVMFSFKRFKWLMDFSMDHDWCAVVRKLLDIMIDGTVGSGEQPSLKAALLDMGLLHRAVRRNCRSMVELLLRYAPATEEFKSANGDQQSYLFRPDAQGPGGLTPLHIAAGRDGCEDILDALTEDPGKIGVEAWKNARDSTDATPEDYARLRGHYAYIHLVQKKINRKPASGHVVVDIPGDSSCDNASTKQDEAATFEIGRSGALTLNKSCKLCDRKMTYHGNARRSMVYRPAMLSMVAVAAVCVCVALLFKSMPNVVCLFQPFRWETLNYGSS